MNYAKDAGLAYSISYPYKSGSTGTVGLCKDKSVTMNNVITGFESCPRGKCTRSQQRALLAKGPLIVVVDADGATDATKVFQHYKSGIIETSCKAFNHGVVLTGVDSDEKGEILLGMNSWGSGWGEKGHFKIRVNDKDQTCFMESYAALPKVKASTNPVPPAPAPTCMKIYSECDQKGDVKEVCGNTPRFENFPKMAGFDIGKFKTAKIFFRNNNCRGGYFTLSSSIECFNGRVKVLNNSIKSVIVDEQAPPQGCVWLYDDSCLSGNKVEVCADVENLNDSKFNFGNKTVSLKLGPGITEITVYMDPNYEGPYTSITSDRFSFEGSWLLKDIESLKITKA